MWGGVLFLCLGSDLVLVDNSGMTRSELLALVKSRHRAAGNKVSRLKSEGIVKIANTKWDVRRDIKKVSKYNTRQLETYLNTLQTFTSRQTRFYGDASMRPLDKNDLALYMERERAVRAKEKKALAQIAKTRLPEPGTAKASKKSQTIGERRSILPTRPAGKNRIVNTPFNTPKRKPSNFKSNESLKVMTKAMGKRLAGDYKSLEIKQQRETFGKMLDVLGDMKLKAKVAELSDSQFDVMWNHSPMPEDVVDIYVLMRKDEKEDDSYNNQKLMSIDQEAIIHSGERIGEWIGWAKSLKLNG